MRKPLLVLGLGVLLVVTSSGFVGCTSLLGDYEVSATGTPTDTEGGPDAPVVCTVCGSNPCVDLATDSANCGACGTVCAGGQTCQASACKCPADQAFCGGQCTPATRQACGATCVACQSDEICNAGCAPAPLPAFETVPRDPTGWTESTGTPITMKLKATGIPGTIYECRTGPDAAFTPTDPPWKPCDGATGANPTHAPKPLAATPEGTYRTEYRYRSDTYRSPTATFQFYAHHALDRPAVCPRPGMPGDGPKFTDAEYFAAAQAHNSMFPGTFVAVDPFPVPGFAATDPFVIRNPFIRIPFTGVRVPGGYNTWPFPPTGQQFSAPFDHVVNERSLRHKFVLNPARTMLLIKRQYEHPARRNCKNEFEFGSEMGRRRGPEGRGRKKLDCEAFIVTVHGLGLCMGRNAAGTAPAPQALDARVHHPTYLDNIGQGSVSGVSGASTLQVSGVASSLAGFVNRWIYVGPQYGGRWYKITAHAAGNPQVFTLATPLVSAVTDPVWRYSGGTTATNVFVAPAGFAHLYDDGKNWATTPHNFGNINPSFSTKCETAGCATGKPWLTYLPP